MLNSPSFWPWWWLRPPAASSLILGLIPVSLADFPLFLVFSILQFSRILFAISYISPAADRWSIAQSGQQRRSISHTADCWASDFRLLAKPRKVANYKWLCCCQNAATNLTRVQRDGSANWKVKRTAKDANIPPAIVAFRFAGIVAAATCLLPSKTIVLRFTASSSLWVCCRCHAHCGRL